ncbi:hypothetical protein T10_8488 [Trichinella papuae]|uniref:Uncharacterized protein n=1 Tax=Trichinella papuae TaxID=268474 RepID=A0A0V1N708_9BILA|nr:hypothetical protein T10_8488 [Trichinella papuae]
MKYEPVIKKGFAELLTNCEQSGLSSLQRLLTIKLGIIYGNLCVELFQPSLYVCRYANGDIFVLPFHYASHSAVKKQLLQLYFLYQSWTEH